jgi:hypothetical protein
MFLWRYTHLLPLCLMTLTSAVAQEQVPNDIITKLVATHDNGSINDYVDSLNTTAQNVLDELCSDADVSAVDRKLKVTAAAISDCLYSRSINNIADGIRSCNPNDKDSYFGLIMIISFEQGGDVIQRVIPYDFPVLKASDSTFIRHHYFEHKELSGVSPDERSEIRTLFVIGFINTLWDQVKDKTSLTLDEKKLLYTSITNYKPIIRNLCNGQTGENETRCKAIRDQILSLSTTILQRTE